MKNDLRVHSEERYPVSTDFVQTDITLKIIENYFKQIFKLKTFAIVFITGFFATVHGQEGRIGINTVTPQTTLDVTAKGGDTDIAGLQAPRLTRAELTLKGDSLYGTDQKGSLIFITDITGGDANSQRAKIDAPGYYYFDGSLWQKIANPSIVSSLEPWHNAANDQPATSNTQNIYQTGNVGIGTNTPNNKLEVNSGTDNNSGIRMTDLTSSSPSGSSTAFIGVDASGDIVRTRNPLMPGNPGGTASPGHIITSIEGIGKGAIILMSGRTACNASDFSLILHLDASNNITIMSQTGGNWSASANIITANYPCGGIVQITFTRSGGTLDLTNTGDNNLWMQGDISMLSNLQ